VIGTVTNVQDPDQKGKIRVKFTGLSDQDESAWARLVSIGGGQKRGVVFIPEVGDEVLVGFENGDVRQPVVFGGLFGAKLDIPKWDVTDGKVGGRRITSREGHYIELSDGDADTAKHIALVLATAAAAQPGAGAQGGTGATPQPETKLRLGADRFDLALPSGKPALIKIGTTEIEITSTGDINMKAPNITIKGDAKVDIQAPQIQIKAQAQLNLESTGSTAVKGSMIEVDASGTAIIKGTGAVMIN
jgi:uncharacterized protein involved in type VI secretion and phage assembly